MFAGPPQADHFTPAADMPWTVASPFRMQPGLSRREGAGHALLLRDAQAPAYARAKQTVLDHAPQRALAGEPDPRVLSAVAEAAARETGQVLAPELGALTLGLQEDMVFLHDEPEPDDGVSGASMRVRALSVCFPSKWRPDEKPGQDFAAIHAPVADNALLMAGARGIVDLAFRQASMLRHVWLLTPDPSLALYPDEPQRAAWAQAVERTRTGTGRLLDQAMFRVERQTTLPLPALGAGVFFIRVMVCPLSEVLSVAPGRAAELARALASMSEAVVTYRGMAEVRGRLLAELQTLAGSGG
jgi:dimethylamine monooxygenase subunit A